MESWQKSTSDLINEKLKKSLELVTSVRGLHMIRTEASKIGILYYLVIYSKKNYFLYFQKFLRIGMKFAKEYFYQITLIFGNISCRILLQIVQN